MANNTADDQESIVSDTATLVEQPSPLPTATLMPNHSIRALRLADNYNNNVPLYLKFTFSIMFEYRAAHAPTVVAINEDLNTLLGDVNALFERRFDMGGNAWRVRSLRAQWADKTVGSAGSETLINQGNVVAVMRLEIEEGGVLIPSWRNRFG